MEGLVVGVPNLKFSLPNPPFVSMGKGDNMESNIASKKKHRILCPECSNYINGIVNTNGSITGQCKICKSIIVTKQCSPKEKRIRVIKCTC